MSRLPSQMELSYPDTGGPYTTEELQAFADMPFGRLGACVREHHDPLWGLNRDKPDIFEHGEERARDWAEWLENLPPMPAAQELANLTPRARNKMLALFENPDLWAFQGSTCGDTSEDEDWGVELYWPGANQNWLHDVREYVAKMVKQKDRGL